MYKCCSKNKDVRNEGPGELINIFIKGPFATLCVQVDPNEEGSGLAEKVYARKRSRFIDHYFYYNGILELDKTLKSQGLKNNSTVDLCSRLRGGIRLVRYLQLLF